jgi:hypothetical protein
MSLLQHGPTSSNDAASGEELTKGSTHLVIAGIVAAVLVSIAIAIYMIAGEKPPAAVGEVISVTAHPMHQDTTGVDANGAPMPKETYDQVLVFAHIKLHNQSKQPLFLRQILSNVTLDDGILSSYAAIPADYERIFQAYPQLASIHGKPLPTDTTIQSGDTLEGDFVSAFRISKEQWDARKSLNFNIGLRYQPDLVLTPKTAVLQM